MLWFRKYIKEPYTMDINDFEYKLTKATIEVGKNVVEDLIRPTSKTIGDNIGCFVDGIIGWLGYCGEKQKIKRTAYLDDYKKQIAQNIVSIPTSKLSEPPTRILGPIIEASKYSLEEDIFRKMFAQLIASSCNMDYAKSIHPAFPEIIQQLSSLDAQLLHMFIQKETFPCVELFEKHIDGKLTPYLPTLIDFGKCPHNFTHENELHFTESLDNLNRLGLILKNKEIIELGYDYNIFKSHWFYTAISAPSQTKQIQMKEYRIELTSFGRAFTKCCF